jgi:phage shock protein C
MNRFRFKLESNLFGVCTSLGEKMSFSANSIRTYFIYASFFTFGSPVIIYLILAFWMEIRKIIRNNQNPSVWEV